MRNILKKFLFLQIFLIYTFNAYSTEGFRFTNPLFNAIEQNNNGEILTLIKSGISINRKEVFDTTPLMRAAFKNNKEIVKLLLGLGANVNDVDIGGATALHIAARTGNSDIVKILLEHQNIFIDPQDKDGWTPLMRSIANQNIKNILLLLDKGANPFKKNKFGQSSISQAILNNNISAIQVFADKNLFSNLDHKTYDELKKLAYKKNNIQIISLIESKPIKDNESMIFADFKQPDLLASIAKEDLIILSNGELANAQQKNVTDDNLSKKNIEAANNILPKEAEIKTTDLKPINNEDIASIANSNFIENNISSDAIKSVNLKPTEDKTILPHFDHYQNNNVQMTNSPYWVEISSNNFTEAKQLYDDRNEEIHNQHLKIRLAKSVHDKKRYIIQAGPVSTQQQVDIICDILSNKQGNCRVIKLINKNNQNRYQ